MAMAAAAAWPWCKLEVVWHRAVADREVVVALS
jgi:hypothetical protein